MLKMTCYKCHWTWSLTPEAAQAAYNALEPGAKHYTSPCPHCGRTNKVGVNQLKRALPRDAQPKAND